MRNRITQLSRFLLLCAVMFLVTMIPQSVKAITVEEAGEAYMTDSQAGAGQPLYGRLNINYTGNTNYDTWSNDIVTNYNTYDSKKDQYKAAETVLKKADNSVIGKKIKNNRSAKLTKSSGGTGCIFGMAGKNKYKKIDDRCSCFGKIRNRLCTAGWIGKTDKGTVCNL